MRKFFKRIFAKILCAVLAALSLFVFASCDAPWLKMLWGEPFYKYKAVWSGNGITVESYGGEYSSINPRGSIDIYGKNYSANFLIGAGHSSYKSIIYNDAKYMTEIKFQNSLSEMAIWYLENVRVKNDTLSFTVSEDYLSVREGKAENEKSSEYVGKKFVLKKQNREPELPTFYFQEKGTWKCDDLTIISDGVTENYPYAETSGTLRLNNAEYSLKISNSAYDLNFYDEASLYYEESWERYEHQWFGTAYLFDGKLYVRIYREYSRVDNKPHNEHPNLLYVLEKQPDGELPEN